MRHARSGQAAMEFLLTYGWAILVVLGAVGALAYFGVLNPSKYLPDKCVFETGLTCSDYQVSTNGNGVTAKFYLQNNLGDTIVFGGNSNDKPINITYQQSNVTCTPASGTYPVTIGVDQLVAFTCDGSTLVSPGKGNQIRLAIDFVYKPSKGYYLHNAKGELTTKVQ